MNNKVKLENKDLYIKPYISPREENYYLITKNEIKSIQFNKLINDIFLMFFSMLFGTFITISLTILCYPDMIPEIKQILVVCKWISLGFSVLFIILSIIYFFITGSIIKGITSKQVSFNSEDDSEYIQPLRDLE